MRRANFVLHFASPIVAAQNRAAALDELFIAAGLMESYKAIAPDGVAFLRSLLQLRDELD